MGLIIYRDFHAIGYRSYIWSFENSCFPAMICGQKFDFRSGKTGYHIFAFHAIETMACAGEAYGFVPPRARGLADTADEMDDFNGYKENWTLDYGTLFALSLLRL